MDQDIRQSELPIAADKAAEAGFASVEAGASPGYSSWFGGSQTKVGPRIGPVQDSSDAGSDSDQSAEAILAKQHASEEGHAIKYKTCSWQKVSRDRHRHIQRRNACLWLRRPLVFCSRSTSVW